MLRIPGILILFLFLVFSKNLRADAPVSRQQPAAVIDFTFSDTCLNALTQFNLIFVAPDSVRWDFDDPATGASNSSIAINPIHVFSAPGTFFVTVTAWLNGIPESIWKAVNIYTGPSPLLGDDITLCQGDILTLDPGTASAGNSFLWNDLSTGPTLDVTISGTYSVTVTNFQNCSGFDEIVVTFVAPPTVNLGPDTSACLGDTFYLNAATAGATYLWQDGSSLSYFPATTSGNYAVTVNIGSCQAFDQVLLAFSDKPQVFLGGDTVICQGTQLFLDASNAGNPSYLWQDGSTQPFLFASAAGTYWVIVRNGDCQATDSLVLDEQSTPDIFLGEDSSLCLGQYLVLDVSTYGGSYLWQDGFNGPRYEPLVSGKYWVEVRNLCGQDADTVNLIFNDCQCIISIPKAFTPNREGPAENEIFRYWATCSEYSGELRIYNRFGQLLFLSNDPEQGWDGTFDGEEAPVGVYVYVLKYRGYDKGRYADETKRGSFALIR